MGGSSRLSKAAPLFGTALFEAPPFGASLFEAPLFGAALFVAAQEMLSIANTICDQTNLSNISLNL